MSPVERLSAPALLRLAVVLSLTGTVVLMAIRVHVLRFHLLSIGGIETFTIDALQRLLLGGRLYLDPEESPFKLVVQTPLYFRITAFIGSVLGVNAHEPHAVYVLSRSVSLAFNLVMAVVVFAVSRRCRVRKDLSWIVGGLVLVMLYPPSWGRPDALYAALFACFLYAHTTAVDPSIEKRAAARWWVISGICAALATWTKQSGVVCVLAAGTCHLIHCDRRAFLGFLLGATVAMALLVVPEIIAVGPSVLYKNLVLTNANGRSFETWISLLGPKEGLAVSVVLAVGGFAFFRIRRGGDTILRSLGIVFVVSLVFALLSSLKSGSGLNYFTEPVICSAVLISAWSASKEARTVMVSSAFTFLIIFRTGLFGSMVYRTHWVKDDREGYERSRALVEKVKAIESQGAVFQTFTGSAELFLPLRSIGTEKWLIEDSGDALQLDLGGLYHALEKATVPVVISKEEPPAFNGHVFTGYSLVYRSGEERIFVPAAQARSEQ